MTRRRRKVSQGRLWKREKMRRVKKIPSNCVRWSSSRYGSTYWKSGEKEYRTEVGREGEMYAELDDLTLEKPFLNIFFWQ